LSSASHLPHFTLLARIRVCLKFSPLRSQVLLLSVLIANRKSLIFASIARNIAREIARTIAREIARIALVYFRYSLLVAPIRRKCRVCMSSDRYFILGQFIARNQSIFRQILVLSCLFEIQIFPRNVFLEATWICSAGSCGSDADVGGRVGGSGS
jgi:hypothetical protein